VGAEGHRRGQVDDLGAEQPQGGLEAGLGRRPIDRERYRGTGTDRARTTVAPA